MTNGRRIEIRGTVQGVGFRPWVVRIARRFDIRGRVFNDARGVVIEAFAEEARLSRFFHYLREDTCPGALIVELLERPIEGAPPEGFSIDRSETAGQKALSIPPDLATCHDCERELSDAADRRYRYAFTNCTQCGPRFTIAFDIPYDRKHTTMHEFEMCDACRREFEDVENRRFHAQPNACPECGPALTLVSESGHPLEGEPIERMANLLRDGAIVAVKGLGGFHLACDATNAEAVRRLRARKRRDEKPFAVMVGSLEKAEQEADLGEAERAELGSRERPIVLANRRSDGTVSSEVAPDTEILGVFLPYTPLHRLLLDEVDRPLVMTSANVSNEPICKDNDEAQRRLAGIADAFLLHDRAIANRCDDSVLRVIDGVPTLIRRSRGFVPRPFRLSRPVAEPVLACGAHLKNAFCVAVDDTAYFGPHVGDLDTLAAFEFFEEAVEQMERILEVSPRVVAHDLHPGYLSTRYAKRRSGVAHVGVQHHHAHIGSVMVEHRYEGPILGLAFDGTGLGADEESSWGGEFLLCSPDRFERLATFRPIRLPGGNVAMHEVWRIAYALLHDAFDGEPPLENLAVFESVPGRSRSLVRQMLERDVNSPRAHGVGRYFDGFGALGLGRPSSNYEGQIAIAWNTAARGVIGEAYPYAIDRSRSVLEIDLRGAVRAMVGDLASGVSVAKTSARFHGTIVASSLEVTHALLDANGSLPVALSGGVFQNPLLSAGIARKLMNKTSVLRHSSVPPGDGGIALGQVLIADAVSRDKG